MSDNLKREFHCPLLNKVIDFAYCYEIDSITFGLCKPSLIDDAVDRETSKPVCKECENKQM